MVLVIMDLVLPMLFFYSLSQQTWNSLKLTLITTLPTVAMLTMITSQMLVKLRKIFLVFTTLMTQHRNRSALGQSDLSHFLISQIVGCCEVALVIWSVIYLLKAAHELSFLGKKIFLDNMAMCPSRFAHIYLVIYKVC